MKSGTIDGIEGRNTSLPPRGAWIEIFLYNPSQAGKAGRSPHGERGLKYQIRVFVPEKLASLPPRGAWIEIVDNIAVEVYPMSRTF